MICQFQNKDFCNMYSSILQYFVPDISRKLDFTNAQFPADLVTFTEEILNGKPLFLCCESSVINRQHE